MQGSISTREKCPCGGKFVSNGTELLCSCGNRPKLYFVYLYWKGKDYRFSRDRDGFLLDSYRRASRLLEDIRRDIERHDFSLSNYLPKEIEEFRCHRLLNRWLETKKDLAPSHTRKVEEYVAKYYLPAFGRLDARTIRAGHIEDFYLGLPEHLSQKTKKNIMAMLRNFCQWLYNREITGRVPRFPAVKLEKEPIKWLSFDLQAEILRHAPAEHQPIISFLINHPVRPGEARALRTKDFDVQNETVSIARTFSLAAERVRKGGEPYVLPLSSSFDASVLQGKLPEAYVFTWRGQPYKDGLLRRVWHRARKAAGISPIKLYNGTRHSIASQAVTRGIDLALVSKALGHSTLQMTKSHYANIGAEVLRGVIERFPEPATNLPIAEAEG